MARRWALSWTYSARGTGAAACPAVEQPTPEPEPEPEPEPPALRILSLNVHGWHIQTRGAFDGLVKMLRAARPDVMALQEASKGRVPELAEALGGMHWTVRHNCAILSHHPLRGLEENQLSGRGKQADNGGRGGKGDRKGRHSVATVSPRDGISIQICCLHLDHVREPTRLDQLRAIAQRQLGAPKPASQLWLGDFNALARSDYSAEAWEAIASHRAKSKWEEPRSDASDVVTNAAAPRKPRGKMRGKSSSGGKKQPTAEGLGFADCWQAAAERTGPLGTSRFGTRIDYIYASAALVAAAEVVRCEHIETIPAVSDHNAVLATLVWRPEPEPEPEPAGA
eukprot:COSAG04_NODE_637_length_11700_cov_478.131885_6_plen_339_part_00